VSLSRRGEVTFVLPSDLPALPAEAKLKASLQLVQADTTSSAGQAAGRLQPSVVATFEKDRTAHATIEVDGLYSASFTLFYESRYKHVVASLRGPTELVHISADGRLGDRRAGDRTLHRARARSALIEASRALAPRTSDAHPRALR
jgi:hypothetical protein